MLRTFLTRAKICRQKLSNIRILSEWPNLTVCRENVLLRGPFRTKIALPPLLSKIVEQSNRRKL